MHFNFHIRHTKYFFCSAKRLQTANSNEWDILALYFVHSHAAHTYMLGVQCSLLHSWPATVQVFKSNGDLTSFSFSLIFSVCARAADKLTTWVFNDRTVVSSTATTKWNFLWWMPPQQQPLSATGIMHRRICTSNIIISHRWQCNTICQTLPRNRWVSNVVLDREVYEVTIRASTIAIIRQILQAIRVNCSTTIMSHQRLTHRQRQPVTIATKQQTTIVTSNDRHRYAANQRKHHQL